MQQRNVLITGASRGIGKSIAEFFIKNGDNCILVARDNERLQTVVQELATDSSKVSGFSCDVGNPHQVNELFNNVEREVGHIDILVNCAGRSGGGVTANITDELWLETINTNLNAVFFVTRTALQKSLIKAGGSIINIASTGGKQGVIHGAPYSASKHGVVGFSKALGLELARANQDITVNAVCPGFVETEMAEKVRNNYARIWDVSVEEAKSRIEARVPVGRYIEPSEVAGMVIYLASEHARGITAQALNVCGGLGNY
ncbi:hypothetical protein N474_19740 [Pseudoalteromonas luteoviolacea CPMOR-2]|uniref:Ketoacyl reductase n=1 Tax=Pseudoalteromonas luteoviolacea DSM 6061 TaxID=1365250 RepID=A0A166VZ18_9GAMM|nr:SDR family NAD(P)-dependent oxidoreductase [Pseudoalteromonas luteoviolacea]KZN34641.1 hypothetical protein N475_19045 [Pseudoalteromonas luteoviolacea DSM 6061]KZN53806.1 hypothetical protein N474_19740 [Pseudoalteromonas luteoviolacea CPMOR-2]MBE0389630.1 3-hydroxybutyrate dehydrogenase [Pseudoalteromonas luteoviolacea DSM 6061]